MADNLLNSEEFNSLSKEEQELTLKILKELGDTGISDTMTSLINEDYEEVPVDIGTFLHDKRYLGNALYDAKGKFTLFPYWEDTLKEIFPTNVDTAYNTLVLTGAIGLGKTLIASICLLYMLYRLLCLKNPYLFYGLQEIDKITISLMNITLENAKGVALDKINQMLLSSSWFMSHGRMSGTENLVYKPNKHIELITASSNNQVIGRCIIANFSDEVNFGIGNDVEKLKKKQKQLISQIDARMKSRFLRGNKLPTLNIIASSKNSDQSFLDEFINNKKKNESKTTLIVDEPQWVVDNRKITDKWFYVALGNTYLASELLPLNATEKQANEYVKKGHEIIKVPAAYYEDFQNNIDEAICSIAGRSVVSGLKYISGTRWAEVLTNKYKNPFISDVIEVGNGKDDTTQYSEFFDLKRVPESFKALPLFIHLDMSIKGDKTGIGGIYIIGKRPKIEGESSSRELFYRVAFNVSIQAPKGYEISFDKNRAFIRWLRDQGFNIAGISSDTFQSAHIQQQLSADGFNVSTISVDRLDSQTKTQLQYAYFKSTIYDRRIEIYEDCELLTKEALGLERESDGHIEHPENGKVGSKDSIDSICGSVWNASQNAENYAYDYGESLEAMYDVSMSGSNYAIDKKQLKEDYQQELKNLFGNKNKDRDEINNFRKDFGYGKPTSDYVMTGDMGNVLIW